MEILLKQIDEVIDLLSQIQAITANQQTILLQKSNADEEQDEIKMIEEMACYKNQLMIEVEKVEQCFEQRFKTSMQAIQQDVKIGELKEKVSDVLDMKEKIVLEEQKNVLILQNKFKNQIQRINIPVSAEKATNAYQKHKKNITNT